MLAETRPSHAYDANDPSVIVHCMSLIETPEARGYRFRSGRRHRYMQSGWVSTGPWLHRAISTLRNPSELHTEAYGGAWRLESWGSRTDPHTATLSALFLREIFHHFQLGMLHNRFDGLTWLVRRVCFRSIAVRWKAVGVAPTHYLRLSAPRTLHRLHAR
ncbi:hypothetical protein P170DRAFT_257966 [Aspergillus steynii IBT 23096]|uniref:Uncharacterized protein n=1 Tax=Aspergillus steynii IBT 23096 TaxID=1392250 RepID=A0A2I2FZD4_9EURO|nr:uncharacterized protein P170DRAFT_257966 [Aspergillus steynii IBT 23096]PLB45987.1 hypothetical protein P170DRAFT_257966 [Aspergillus steynii IBT 23096]